LVDNHVAPSGAALVICEDPPQRFAKKYQLHGLEARGVPYHCPRSLKPQPTPEVPAANIRHPILENSLLWTTNFESVKFDARAGQRKQLILMKI
jgi:hypothetical protein